MSLVTGIDAVIKNLSGYNRRTALAIGRAVERTAVDVANDAKKNHGRGRRTGGKKGQRVGGAHGLTPPRYEVKTGTLTRSIMPTNAVATENAITASVQTDMEYARGVELGTVSSKPYPFLYPALAGQKEKLAERCKEAMAGGK